MILLQRYPRLVAGLFGLLLACPSFAHATKNYYVDCNYGSNGNSGTSPQQAWRTLLEVGISSFQPGDTINLLRDCTWNETLTPPSSGTNPATGGALIKIDSYGNGQPPHLTGYLPIAAKWWTQVGSTNVWSATLYSGTSGLTNVLQCGIRGFYCLTQAPSQLQYVRFGTEWGTAQGSTQSRSGFLVRRDELHTVCVQRWRQSGIVFGLFFLGCAHRAQRGEHAQCEWRLVAGNSTSAN